MNFYEVDEENRATYFRREARRFRYSNPTDLVYSDGLFTVSNGRAFGGSNSCAIIMACCLMP